MGFSDNGMISIRLNHGMLHSRERVFKQQRKRSHVGGDLIKVNDARMERLAKDARNAAWTRFAIAILTVSIIILSMAYV